MPSWGTRVAAGLLADVDGHPAGHEVGMDEPVVDDDVGRVEGGPSPDGDEVGIARAGTDDRNPPAADGLPGRSGGLGDPLHRREHLRPRRPGRPAGGGGPLPTGPTRAAPARRGRGAVATAGPARRCLRGRCSPARISATRSMSAPNSSGSPAAEGVADIAGQRRGPAAGRDGHDEITPPGHSGAGEMAVGRVLVGVAQHARRFGLGEDGGVERPVAGGEDQQRPGQIARPVAPLDELDLAPAGQLRQARVEISAAITTTAAPASSSARTLRLGHRPAADTTQRRPVISSASGNWNGTLSPPRPAARARRRRGGSWPPA